MGIIQRNTMVLLSTLAALVIIVHSAHEDYEGHYRRELRPRMLDTGTRRHEQPWRTMRVEPILPSPDPIFEESSTEEPLRRRRPGRKRKRRPEPYSIEAISSQERISIDESLRPNIEIEDIKPADPPKRRRKKQDRSKLTDNEDRPMRRRGHRRKRPKIENWPVLSEFNDYRPNKNPHEEHFEISTDETDLINIEDPNQNDQEFRGNSQTHLEIPISGLENLREEHRQHATDDSGFPLPAKEVELSDINPILKEDKSYSEFSVEEYPVHDTRSAHEMAILKEKMRDKSSAYFKDFLKSQDKGPIDPLTLKEILKKSNGSSLSEILQQHNLSLTDLLHGKEVALSILKSEDIGDQTEPVVEDHTEPHVLDVAEVTKQIQQENIEEETESSEEQLLQNSETKYVPDPIIDTTPTSIIIQEETTTPEIIKTTTAILDTTTEKAKLDDSSKRSNTRRFPVDHRRKQHIRPVINTNTYKSPLNRDMIAMNARKYFSNHRRRNVTRTPEWKDVIPIAKKNITNSAVAETINTTTANAIVEETTLPYKQQDDEDVTIAAVTYENNVESKDTPHKTTSNDLIINESTNSETNASVVNNEKLIPIRQTVNATGLRRQAYNNVLKKKRRKLKYSTTEPPQDDLLKNLFGIPNLVSSSEFIARTQGPKTSLDDVTILEDFITTETVVVKKETKPKHTRYSTSTVYNPIVTTMTTEETAKIEIEEILNDSGVSAKLSKILEDRNMTLSELIKHRERGSSHVHLADIFQNTSKEVSNPPEPFLSKSFIEPISKETYPLRALLEGKIHDTTTKATTPELNAAGDYQVSVPVKMDFGNNVNENAENMGIMSLFHNITTQVAHEEDGEVTKDSEGRPYTSSVTVVNATDASDANDTVRKGRLVNELKENQDDIVSWNEIFSLMRRNYENRTKYIKDGVIPAESIKKPTLEEDLDGDGLIVLEDLQHLHDFDRNIAAAKDNLDAKANEITEAPVKPSILDKLDKPSQTRSVTLVTASIVGLAMVLFLLTYVGYKWRQHNRSSSKKNFDERIPSPVFENRKGHKNNSSSRSISPMLTSNIYTLSTVDSQNGKESPEYMWDSLRKPFQ